MHRHACKRRLVLPAAGWVAAVAALTGCERASGPPSPRTDGQSAEPRHARTMPDVPADEQTRPGAADVLIRDTTVQKKYARPLYQQKDMPAGTLRGLFFVNLTGRAELPTLPPVDPQKGPHAIPDPLGGEVDYYRKGLRPRSGCIQYNRKTRRHHVTGAALMVRGIKAGLRPPLSRLLLSAWGGRFTIGRPYFGTAFNVGFSPFKDRIQVANYDEYPAHMALRRAADDKVIWEAPVGRKTDKRTTHNIVFSGGRVRPTQTTPIKQMGLYCVQCRRHPWQKKWIWVVDNPYVVPLANDDRGGTFTMAGIPVGSWSAEVWHPTLQPVKKTLSFTIVEDETTEIGVEFRPPPELRAPAAKQASPPAAGGAS